MWLVWVRGEAYRGFCWENPRERYHLEDPGVDGRLILRWFFRKWNMGLWTGSSWLMVGQVTEIFECGNELSGSIKYGEFLD